MKIYKIVSEEAWLNAEASGVFQGSQVDLEDGFIHFSAKAQLQSTLRKHFSDSQRLLLVEVESDKFDDKELRWEESHTSGGLFPHLYKELALSHVLDVMPIEKNDAGEWELPVE